MADALDRRTYESVVKRHRKNADRALRDLKASLGRIDPDHPGIGANAVRNAAGVLAELGHSLAALEALADISFLADEKTNG